MNNEGDSDTGTDTTDSGRVEDIQESLYSKLTQNFNDGLLEKIFKDVFPNATDEQREDLLKYIDESIQSGDWSWLPAPKLVSDAELEGNNGAYAADGDLIFINEEVSLETQQETYWEEIGHFLDDTYLTHGSDTAGDEGELFRLALSGDLYENGVLNTELASETIDEQDTITVDGKEYDVEFNSEDDVQPPEFTETLLGHYSGYFSDEGFPNELNGLSKYDLLNQVRESYSDQLTGQGVAFETIDHLFRGEGWSDSDFAAVRDLFNQFADNIQYDGESINFISKHSPEFEDFMQALEGFIDQMPAFQGPSIHYQEPGPNQPDVAMIAIIRSDSTTIQIEINKDQTQRAVITQEGDSDDTYIEEHRDSLGFIQSGTRVENGKTVEEISRGPLGSLVTEFFDPNDSSLLRTEVITADGLLEVTEPTSTASTEGFPSSLNGASVRTTYANDTDDASMRGTVMSQALLDNDGNVLAVRTNLGDGQFQVTTFDADTGDITGQSGANNGAYISPFTAPTAPPRFEGPRDIPNSIHLTDLPVEEGQTFLDRNGAVVQTRYEQDNVTTTITYNDNNLPNEITSVQTDGSGNVVRKEVTTIDEQTNEARTEIFTRNDAGALVPERLQIHGSGFTEHHAYQADGTLSPNVIRENHDGLTEYLTYDAPGGELVSKANYRQGELQSVITYGEDGVATATRYEDGVAQEPERVMQILLDSQTTPTWGSADAFFDTDLLTPAQRALEFAVDDDGNVIIPQSHEDSGMSVEDYRTANLLGHSLGAAGIDLTSRIADGKITLESAANLLNLQRFTHHPAQVLVSDTEITYGPDGEVFSEGYEVEQRWHDYESQRAADVSSNIDDAFFQPTDAEGEPLTDTRYNPADHLDDPDGGFGGTRLPASSADEAYELTLDVTGTFKFKNADDTLQEAAGFLNKLFDRNIPKTTGWYGGGLPNLVTGQILGNAQDLYSVAGGLLQKHSRAAAWGSDAVGIGADLAKFDKAFTRAGIDGADAASDFARKVFAQAIGEVGEAAALKAAKAAQAAVNAAPLLVLDFAVNIYFAVNLFIEAAETKDPLTYVEATLALFGLDFLVAPFKPSPPPPPIQVDNRDELSSRGELYYQLTANGDYGVQYAEDQAEAYIDALEQELIYDHLPPGYNPNDVQIEYFRGAGDDGQTFISPVKRLKPSPLGEQIYLG